MSVRGGQILAVLAFAAGGATLVVTSGDPPPEASAPRPQEIRVQTLQSDTDLIEVSFQVPELEFVSDAGQRGKSRVEMAGTAPYSTDGFPEVPVYVQYIAIPSCDRVELSATAEGIDVIQNVTINLHDHSETRTPTTPDSEKRTKPYQKDIDFPEAWARLKDIQHLRGQALARVELYPVRFNGHRRQMAVAREIILRLRPINASGPLAVHAGPLQPVLDALVPNLGEFGSVASNNSRRRVSQSDGGHVFWCDTADDDWEAAADFVSVTAEADYLMIVADELVADSGQIGLIQQLADWHAAYHGFNVAVVRMKQIDHPLLIFGSGGTPSTPSVIRDFIKEVYDNATAAHMGDDRLGYVLLVGDAYNPSDQILIPPFYFVVGSGYHTENKNGSDTYYSLLSGTPFGPDVTPDLLIGRLPIDADEDDWELTNVVQKILSYEPTPVLNAWSSKGLLMSGIDDGSFTFDGEGISGFETYFDEIEDLDVLGVRGFTQMHRLAGNSDAVFSKDVCDEISEGYGLVGLFDHANPVNFAGAFYPLHYDTLSNDDEIAWPLVLSFGSYSGYFDRLLNTPGYTSPPCCPSSEFTGGIPCQTPDTPIDNCDALTERLMVQRGGAIGVIAYSRTNQAVVVQRAFANAFRTILQHNMGSLGAALIGMKLLTTDDVTTAALHLLGDPAINFQHQFDSVETDSFDVVVRGPSIVFTSAVHAWCGAGVPQTISIAISNEWKDPVEDVPVEVWDGPGGVGSTLLASFVVPNIAAYDTTIWTGSVGSFAVGDHDIYVMADPEHTLLEAPTANNVSFATLHVRSYSDGFPIALSEVPTGAITIADLVLDSANELEVLAHVGSYYPIYSADGDFVSQSFGQMSIPPAGSVFRSNRRQVVTWFNAILDEVPVNVFDASTATIISDGLRLPTKLDSRDPPPILFDLGSPDSMLLAVRTHLEGPGLTTNIRAYKFSGAQKWARPIGDLSHGTHNLLRFSMASADITGDGASDVVYSFVSDQGGDSIGVIDGTNGLRVWAASPGSHDAQRLYVRPADLEIDGTNEILTNTRVGPDLRILCYEASGALRWSVSVAGFQTGELWRFFSCDDLDGNGTKEVVFTDMNRLGVIEATGTSASVDRYIDLEDAIFFSTPITIDIDSDGDKEIVVLVRQWNRYLNEYRIAVHVYEADLAAAEAAYDFPWLHPLDAKANEVIEPAAGDIDGDGVFEVVFATPDGALHAVDVGTSAGKAGWTQVYGDALHTGFPYELSLSGTYSGPVAVNHGARVVGDATFEGGLTITAPSIVRVAEDALVSVEAAFGIYGSQYDSVRVEVTGEAPGGSSWQGIVVDDLSTRGEIRCAVLTHVTVALESGSPVRVRNSRFSGIENTAIVASDSLWLIDSAVLSPGGNGIELATDAIGAIHGSEITNAGMTGVVCDGCNPATEIRETTVESANDYGFHIVSTEGLTVESSVAENCGSAGIRFEWADATIETSRFENNPIGIACLDESSPKLAQSRVLGSTVGVSTVYDSYPILGDGISSAEVGGNNCIHNSSSHHVVNLSTGGAILARWNYWGSQCCNPAKFSGNVICSNCVPQSACNGAAAIQVLLGPNTSDGAPAPRAYELIGATPNPFNPTTRIRFAVPEPGGMVTIVLYNVRGQQLAILQNGYLTAGRYDRVWDGRDDRGVQAASGVYFVRMKAGTFQKTVKAVLLK